jgi:hypothetical protein
MDTSTFLSKLDTPPRWASNWCYFYLLTAALLGLSSFFTLILLVLAYGKMKKGQLGLLVGYSIALVFQAIGAMVMFWMCRSSLKTKN